MATVVILMGSKSDEEKVVPCAEILKKLGVDYFLTVSSAHRTPERTEQIIREQEACGAKIFICAAGMAAHLAGAVAARTTCPVIGIPISGTAFGGMDALLSTVQMPPDSRLPPWRQTRPAQRRLACSTNSCLERSGTKKTHRARESRNARRH